jgi:hypothetical protein
VGCSSRSAGAARSSKQQQQGTAGSRLWTTACALAQQLPPRQQDLLQALNCSGKVLLWAAPAHPASKSTLTHDIGALVDAYRQAV